MKMTGSIRDKTDGLKERLGEWAEATLDRIEDTDRGGRVIDKIDDTLTRVDEHPVGHRALKCLGMEPYDYSVPTRTGGPSWSDTLDPYTRDQQHRVWQLDPGLVDFARRRTDPLTRERDMRIQHGYENSR